MPGFEAAHYKRVICLIVSGTIAGALLLTAVGAASRDSTRIKSIKRAEQGIEIEIHSTRPFPVRAQRTVLKIGEFEFVRSRYPADGTHNTLFFKLTEREFADLLNGDFVRVQYGLGRNVHPNSLWEVGRLDKRQLDRPESKRIRRSR